LCAFRRYNPWLEAPPPPLSRLKRTLVPMFFFFCPWGVVFPDVQFVVPVHSISFPPPPPQKIIACRFFFYLFLLPFVLYRTNSSLYSPFSLPSSLFYSLPPCVQTSYQLLSRCLDPLEILFPLLWAIEFFNFFFSS